MEMSLPYTQEEIIRLGFSEAMRYKEKLADFAHDYERVGALLDELAGAFVEGALSATGKIETGREGARSYQYTSGKGNLIRRFKGICQESTWKRSMGGLADVSLSAETEGEEETEGRVSDNYADPKAEDPAEVFGKGIDNAAAVEALQALPERTRQILIARYIDGKTGEQVAEETGLTSGRISQIEKAARETLQRLYRAA